MKPFKVNGILFRVTDNGTLQYFTSNFGGQTGINGLSGFWDTITNVASGVGNAIKNVATNVAQYMPSSDTIVKAAGIAATIYSAKLAVQQQQSQLKLQALQQPNQNQMTDSSGYYPSAYNQQYLPSFDSNYNNSNLSPNTMLIIGGALLVVLLLVNRK